jgi:transcriptional regulator of aromatic amino acid metabolism
MFKRKKVLERSVARLRTEVKDIDYGLLNVRRELSIMHDKVDAMGVVKHDMVKMDALVAMMSELARRVDLAGIADLPNECVCEACGCNKDDVTFQRLDSIDDIETYCTKCKDKRTMVDFVIKTSDSGRRMATGKCPVCSTKVHRILGKVRP